ncbi:MULTISPECIES: triose-phosphate isomerase [Pseudoalteromonas]|uniref:Triosephosphate isomerase n=1 Tax=Pseudoalteromonas obscura TaxID=3048491 RepID=A0ABT7EHD5_9GAMM|nr:MULTISPECIES: triose-phosphate isomerase [Pseudoalteromonas]MBQ4836089.1 triose-phosphate isomerase [Pseudoalteromonas luteoviolacea]MDK2594437.1 triose-phosphate isomerase [Pseudoalteromonas sp. P94(2023)]
MLKRKPMVAGNWKMNGSLELVQSISSTVKNINNQDVEVVVIPPTVLLSDVIASGVVAGVQTVSEHSEGAYTGEVQASLVKSLGATYTLVGHSERRSIFGESNEDVANKFAQAQANGLTPILCVGETESQREQAQTEEVVAEQIIAVIDKLGIASLANSVIAYEPVWAIGTGKTATPEQAQAVHKFIRNLVSKYDADISETLQILYGGSVNESNSELLFAQADIDGGLIGGASLKPESFKVICESAKG